MNPIKLRNLVPAGKGLKTLDEDGLVNLEKWNFSDIEMLIDIGFKISGDHELKLENPEMSICKKGGLYILDEPTKQKREFNSFASLLRYFDEYKQDEFEQ